MKKESKMVGSGGGAIKTPFVDAIVTKKGGKK